MTPDPSARIPAGSWIWPVVRTGFRRQMVYRRAMAMGAIASLAYSAIRLVVLHALYQDKSSVAGLEFEQVVTWALFAGMLFAVVWVPWGQDFPESIRSGAVLGDLLRPVNPFSYQLTHQLGRLGALVLVRILPWLLVGIWLLPVPAPRGMVGWSCLGVSLVLLAITSLAYIYMLGSTAFFTPDYHVWMAFAFYLIQLIGGLFVPLEFIPGIAGTLVRFGPGMAFIASPTRIVNDIHPVQTLGVQFVWTAVFCLVAYYGLHAGRKRLVLHGG